MYRPHGAPAATRLLRPVSHWPLFESGQQRIATRGSPGENFQQHQMLRADVTQWHGAC
jgi:hypothetical protein